MNNPIRRNVHQSSGATSTSRPVRSQHVRVYPPAPSAGLARHAPLVPPDSLILQGLTGPVALPPTREIPEVYLAGDPMRMHPKWVNLLRTRMHAERPQVNDTFLERFLNKVFQDNLMVEVFHHMHLPKAADPAVPTPALFPLLEAIRAGKRAASMKVIDTRERGFVFTAAMVQSCALFHCAHPYVKNHYGPEGITSAEVQKIKLLLLEDALRDLRSQDTARGETMTAVLDHAPRDVRNAEQVARIAAAVHLSNLPIQAEWGSKSI